MRSSLAPGGFERDCYWLQLGICKTAEAEEALVEHGIERSKIWMCGRDAETVEDAIYYCRQRPSIFYFSEDLRILGDSQAAIFDATKAIAKAGIVLRDINNPEHDNNDMQKRAFQALHSSSAMRNHRTARRRGKAGGEAKAAAYAARRNELIDDATAWRLCASRLTWKEKSTILGMSISTIQRVYRK